MRQYTQKEIDNLSGWMKDRCREDWFPEYKGRLAILVSVKKRGIKSPKGQWLIEGIDFEIIP